ncbi:solute carrier family 22 member 13-like isoform X2 [Harpia harpyja]|uniref:solute carrier family 22 member 13-like isoform X2 n=1 Tax=Harpia harpyja TaxID=202280 RepID=UPI0022B13CF5|nr:solute carrier family 22 member 13-like isoform X2 [Harpia harpyja]
MQLPMSGVGEIWKAVGDFGPFQKWLVLLTLFPCLSVAFHQFCQLFMVQHVPHRCDTSWIRAIGPNLTEEEQLNLTLPRDADGAYEQCSMYSPVDWDLGSIMLYGLNATEKCSNGWVYPSAQPPSLLTEFDLVCDRKDLNDISQSIYMMGLFLGSMIFGPLSDRIGRRPVILISIFLQGLFGVGIAFVPHFYVYMAFRCVVGASVSGITMTILALATEWVGVSSRPKAVLISHCCFAIGQMILAGLSYGIRNWRLLQIAGSAPIFALFFYIWVLPESARWLATKGRIEEAKKVLQKAASINKRTISPGLLEQLKPEKQTKSGSPLDLFRKKHLRKVTLIMSCAWFVNSLVYYGLSLNVTNFGLDIYLTQLAFGAVEIPARIGCIFILQWFGRKKSQAVLLLLSGLVCLIITGIPEALASPPPLRPARDHHRPGRPRQVRRLGLLLHLLRLLGRALPHGRQADRRGTVLHVGAAGGDRGPADPPPGPVPPRRPHGHLRERPRGGGAALPPLARDPRHRPGGRHGGWLLPDGGL